MGIIDPILREFDAEMPATRRLLERVPDAKLEWKPHAKSKSMKELAVHIAELPRWGLRIGQSSWAVGSEKAPPLSSAAEVLARFDENAAACRAAIAGKTDEELKERITVTRAGAEFFTLPKITVLRRVLLNHLIHHRGQLTVYLRLHDVPLPSVYGPTADEV